jgi:glutamate-1-semialdehyde 2,1-aminomutase
MTETLTTNRSAEAFAEACKYIAGGVNSPVRAFKAVGGTPVFIREGKAGRITDVDGRTYIDLVGSWGPLIVGHAHPQVVAAVSKALARGSSFGAPTELETRLAKMVVEAVPSIQLVRFVNSGTEATMSAIRLARAFTRKNGIIKFAGCYHGHADPLLVQAGSGATTLGTPSSPGVPADVVKHTYLCEFNDLAGVKKTAKERSKDLAAILVEPVPGNMGVVVPDKAFLAGLREICDKHKALLIFDEVITGFRLARGGAQELFGIKPDLTCLGKIIGGGLPVGAYGGRKDVMEMMSPAGPVYQAGTLSGNPLAMAAGVATLEVLFEPGGYERLESMSARLGEGIAQAAARAGVTAQHTRVGSMLCTFFTDRPVRNYTDAKTSDTARYGRFFHAMLERRIYIAPAQFEALLVGLAHTDEDIDATVAAAEESFRATTA